MNKGQYLQLSRIYNTLSLISVRGEEDVNLMAQALTALKLLLQEIELKEDE